MLSLPLLGQLFGAAFACGLNLYGTVALVGLASRFGWIDGLPAGLRGLENGVVLGSAAVLFLIDFVIDKVPYVDSVWDAVHTLIRPICAAALAFLALGAAPIDLQIAGGAVAGVIALASHSAKAGLRVAINARPRQRLTVMLSLLENTLAIAMAFAALTYPLLALAALAVLGVLMIPLAPSLWRAAVLGLRATAARIRGFFGSPGWLDAHQLPRTFRPLIADHDPGTAPHVATRAALVGLRRAGAYRNGWLVLDRTGTGFVYRSLLRSRRIELPQPGSATVRKGLLTDIIEVEPENGGRRFTLFLLKDGPPTDIALSRLGARAT